MTENDANLLVTSLFIFGFIVLVFPAGMALLVLPEALTVEWPLFMFDMLIGISFISASLIIYRKRRLLRLKNSAVCKP